jgi:RecA/RadA recombinase
VQSRADFIKLVKFRTCKGCITLDAALGGGLPKGRVVEIFGPESSGKTTLALHAIAEVQKNGGATALERTKLYVQLYIDTV